MNWIDNKRFSLKGSFFRKKKRYFDWDPNVRYQKCYYGGIWFWKSRYIIFMGFFWKLWTIRIPIQRNDSLWVECYSTGRRLWIYIFGTNQLSSIGKLWDWINKCFNLKSPPRTIKIHPKATNTFIFSSNSPHEVSRLKKEQRIFRKIASLVPKSTDFGTNSLASSNNQHSDASNRINSSSIY